MRTVEVDAGRSVISDEITRRWLEQRGAFLSFLLKRTTRAEAEEILQTTFLKALEHADELRREVAAVAWFYRLLRNALVDHQRRVTRERAQLDDASPVDVAAPEVEPPSQPCRCVGALMPRLPAEHAELLDRVELRGQRVIDAAHELGISPNHAAVRLGRARRALRLRVEHTCGSCAAHGCFQCSCSSIPA